MKFALIASLALIGSQAVKITSTEDEGADEVSISILDAGNGELCQAEQTAAVQYTGALTSNGKVFDSSIPRGQPITFKIGDFRVISCWETAIVQMKVGEKADIVCPAKTAYGQRSKPNIPAGSDLTFNVEVVSCE